MGLCLMGWSSFLGRLERKTDRVLYQNIAELQSSSATVLDVAEALEQLYYTSKIYVVEIYSDDVGCGQLEYHLNGVLTY